MATKKTQAGTNVGKVKQQNAGGQFGTEFASETDAQEVRSQNQQSQSKAAQQSNAGGQFGTEFASETDVQEVKRQNQQSQSKAAQGNLGQE